jgi:hypothetical protein
VDGDHAAPVVGGPSRNRGALMTVRLFAAVVAICCATLSIRAADDENPYKNAKVGDFATYKMSMKVAEASATSTWVRSPAGWS